MDSRQRNIFWSLHYQLLKHLEFKCYYLLKRDWENHYQETENVLSTINSLQTLIQPPEKQAETVTSYFD